MIVPYQGKLPRFDDSVFVEASAQIIGDVELGPDASVWFGAVIRGDVNSIRIGARSNIQDLTVIHVDRGTSPTFVGDEVTVGHRVILHGCRVGDRALIGMGSVLLNDVQVGAESLVAAGSVVSPGTVIPSRKLALGVPARVVRDLRREELEHLRSSAQSYVELKSVYMKEHRRV